ncbi:hypothetical protein REPUB_Repub03eG0039600 [Reevesia pubescens]
MLEVSMSTVPSTIWASILSWFTPTVFFVFLNITIGTLYFTSSLASNNPGVGGVEGQRQEGDETNPKLVRSPSVLQRLKSINLYSYRSQEPVTVTATATATAYEKVTDADGDFHFSFQQQTTPEQDQRQQQQPYLDRSPSVLQRLKSINLYSYFSPEPTTLQKSPEIYSHYTPEPADEQVQQPEEEEEEENQGGIDQEEKKGEEDEGTQGEQTLDEIYGQLKDSHVTRTKSDTKPASGEVPTKLPRKMKKSASSKSTFSHFEEEDIVETRLPATVREGKAKATEEDDEVDAKADDFINKFRHQLKLQRIDSFLRYKDMVNRGSGR